MRFFCFSEREEVIRWKMKRRQTTRWDIMALRVITLGYLFAGVNISLQGVFQSLDYGVHSLILSVVRLLVPALPLAWLFTGSADAEKLIWWAFPVSELCGTVTALVFMKNIYKKVSKS